MRVVLQRVTSAGVQVDGETVAEIGAGLLILIGAGHGDNESGARDLAEKIAGLRIFEDQAGKTNRSIMDVRGEALVVSQFTLYADTRKGRRPSFTDAAPAEAAASLVDFFSVCLANFGIPVRRGRFGVHMQVSLVNDGPMTILLER